MTGRVVYETNKAPQRKRRYVVQWRSREYASAWVPMRNRGYRTAWMARLSAGSWASEGYMARVIDTRAEVTK